MRTCVGALFVALFILPYVLLSRHVQVWEWPAIGELISVLSTATLQAGFSALLSCVCGVAGAYGILSLRSLSLRNVVEMWALAPQVIPTLAVLLSILNLFGTAAMSLAGVIFVHVLINVGVVSVWWSRVLTSKVGGMAELAHLEGATRLRLAWVLHRYLLPDLGIVFLFVFILCFSSFAIPLVLGGNQALTLEVLIYQKLRLGNGLGPALILSLLQVIFVLTLTVFITRPASAVRSVTSVSPLLRWRGGLAILGLATGLVLYGLVVGLRRGVFQLMSHPLIWTYALESVSGSLVVSLSVGVFTLCYLYLTAWLWPQRFVERFFLAWVAPSSVLTGLALILIPDQFDPFLVCLKLGLGLSLLMFPAIYRLGWHSALSSLRSQYEVAQTLGAKQSLVLRQVMWPQLQKSACLLAGLASFWGMGEFALSRLVVGRDVTLSLVIQSLLHSYRLDMAIALVWLLVGVGCLVYFLFWSLAHVTSFKSRS